MKPMKAGVTKAGKGIDNLSWSILGQTYVPKALTESAFSWHALLPPGTFVPPHIHTNQDEFIYVLEGELTYRHGRKLFAMSAGDSLLFDAAVPHGPEKLSKTPVRYVAVLCYPRNLER